MQVVNFDEMRPKYQSCDSIDVKTEVKTEQTRYIARP